MATGLREENILNPNSCTAGEKWALPKRHYFSSIPNYQTNLLDQWENRQTHLFVPGYSITKINKIKI